jgi:hypothetical protein
MSKAASENTEVRLSWILLFLLMALGMGAAAIFFSGGTLLAGGVVGVPFVF